MRTKRTKNILIGAVCAGAAAVVAVPIGLAAIEGPSAVEVLPGPPPGGGALDTGASLNASMIELQSGAAEKIARTEALADAPWLFQPEGARFYDKEPPRPSLSFPRGTNYADALDALYRSVARDGSLPPGTSLREPLQDGRILQDRSAEAGGISIDLRAPWGYEPDSKAITAPAFTLPGSWSPERVDEAIRDARERKLSIPVGARATAPLIPACEIATAGEAQQSPDC